MTTKGWIRKQRSIWFATVILLLIAAVGVVPVWAAGSSPAQFSNLLQEPQEMPPRPDVYQAYKFNTKILGEMSLVPAYSILVESSVPADSATTATTGFAKVLVIMIDFPEDSTYNDLGFIDPIGPITFDLTHTESYWNLMLFDTTNPKSLASYYKEMSYGKLSVQGVIFPQVVHSSHSMAYYGGDSPDYRDSMNTPRYELAREAVQLALRAAPTFDFSQFDINPQDGVIDHLIIIHAGKGQEGLANYDASPNSYYIWSHRWAILNSGEPAGNVVAFGYTMQPDDGQVGVFAHEFGHDLGLPDLYDRTLSSEGLGNWSLMAGGSWNGSTPNIPNGTNPAQMTAWEKIKLGWLTPLSIDGPRPISLPTTSEPGNNNPVVYKLSFESNPDEYFLLENRQQVGFDSGLPGAGLLIYHIDDTVTTQNDNPLHYLVALEQADNQRDLENHVNRGDDGDPYPGSSNNRSLTDVSAPNDHSYTGAIPKFKITDISDSAPAMTVYYSAPVTPTDGGIIGNSDGVKIVIPPWAVLKETAIAINPVSLPSPPPKDVRALTNQKVWDLTPTGMRFNKPVTLTLPYDLTSSSGIDENKLRIFYWDPQEVAWLPVGGKVDAINKSVTADINHFSVYTVMESSLLVPASSNLISYLALTNNPFSPNGDGKKDNTIFKFALVREAKVNIRIYDSQGNLVLPLVEGINQMAGLGSIVWDGTNNAGQTVGSGIYVFKIEATDGQGQTQTMTKPVAVVLPR